MAARMPPASPVVLSLLALFMSRVALLTAVAPMLRTVIQLLVDALAALIQPLVDAVAFLLELFGALLAAMRQGTRRALVILRFKPVAPLIQALLDAIPLGIQALRLIALRGLGPGAGRGAQQGAQYKSINQFHAASPLVCLEVKHNRSLSWV